LLLTAWFTITEYVPMALVMVYVAPEFVQAPELVYATLRPELALATTLNCCRQQSPEH
jgi:hypothetical protein